jgi:hypothetical protein
MRPTHINCAARRASPDPRKSFVVIAAHGARPRPSASAYVPALSSHAFPSLPAGPIVAEAIFLNREELPVYPLYYGAMLVCRCGCDTGGRAGHVPI